MRFALSPERVECKIGSIELDESDAASVKTLVFTGALCCADSRSDLASGGTLTLPSHCFQSVEQLEFVHCHMQGLELQEGACPVGTLLELSSCRQCETLVLGKDCFSQGEMLRVTRVPNLYLIEVGENAFENAEAWNISGGRSAER